MDLVEIRKKAKKKKDASGAGKKKVTKKKAAARTGEPGKKPRKSSPQAKSKTKKPVEKVRPAEAAAPPAAQGPSQALENDRAVPVPVEPAVSPEPPPEKEATDKVAVQDVDTLDEILLAQTRKPEQEVEEKSLQLLTFTIGEEEYGLSIMDIKEIVRPQETTDVPKTPDYVMGIISLRGMIIPIFDVRMRLGLSEGGDNPKARIIVVSLKDNFYGLLVDSVVQVINIPISSIEPPPEIIGGVDADYLKGVGKIDDRLVILLNLERVVSIDESKQAQEAN